MKEIKLVIPEQGEKLSVNAGDIHNQLLTLPADMYVSLYHMMKNRMEGKVYVSNGGCISNGTIGLGMTTV